ncbi:FAD binding domain-containing protein [Microbacterium sp. ASV81]|uniref:FAD binding domain-containing protein n=1 Tax=Microbacterium capsulatum TaxID=3041921 RepID=A0ABU0XJJ6_9MICO|nr:FAD binding domain-containing protein [Microbacterium sp. ASV81]MDQ4215293.1 FAD binding domain-containing protein [Microbacterium sp. ASV81]
MDVTSVDEVRLCADPAEWRPGDSWLAGGTVLYSYGTDITRGAPTRLLDITAAGWEPFAWRAVDGGFGLEIAATCRIADLYALPARPDLPAPRAELPGLDIVTRACDAFVASWKIWHVSTVGGNVATALPAGPMISLLSAWDATALILRPDGTRRTVPVAELVLAPARTGLGDGELIRSFHVPARSLRETAAFRRISLTERGRSAALLVGRRTSDTSVRLTVTASTSRPVQLDLAVPGTDPHAIPADGAAWRGAIDAAVDGWYDDIHGDPSWRRLMTHRLGDEILAELLPGLATGVDDAIGRVSGDLSSGSLSEHRAAERDETGRTRGDHVSSRSPSASSLNDPTSTAPYAIDDDRSTR